MKYGCDLKLIGSLLMTFLRKKVPDREKRKAVLREYNAILTRAGEIGSPNPLVGSYALAAFFIAMVREGGISPQETIDAMERMLREFPLSQMMFGNADSYLSEKKMAERQKWSARTKERKYPNDWVVEILPGNGDYALGYDYLECGDCKLCRDEGCPELAKYLCTLDFTIIELVGLRLERTQTLAEGGDKCDFRFYRKTEPKK